MSADLKLVTETLLGIGIDRPHVELPAEGSLPCFHAELYKHILSHSEFRFTEDAWLKTKELIPFVDFLTQPRNISEHRNVLEASLAVLHENDYSSESEDNLHWVAHILDKFTVVQFDCGAFEDITNGVSEPSTYWTNREDVTPPDRIVIQPEEKVVDQKQLMLRLKELKEHDEINVGALTGKWRIGPHSEQLDTIRQAKRLLGPRSVLIAFLEGKESVLMRKGENHIVFTDDERSQRLIDNNWVDFVCTLDPKTGSDLEMRRFYEDVWSTVGLDYYFVGAKDHPLTSRFCNYGRDLGTIVLWAREKNRISTTNIVKDIAKQAREGNIT